MPYLSVYLLKLYDFQCLCQLRCHQIPYIRLSDWVVQVLDRLLQ
jgi:hypothetical protein